jgi:hypothetical protein
VVVPGTLPGRDGGPGLSEQLDIEPARFFVIRHIRPQYACRRQCETITAAPVAPVVIDGSRPADLGGHQQVPGSLAALPAGTDRRAAAGQPVTQHHE